MPAHIACRPFVLGEEHRAGCFVVCADHGVHQSFATAHDVAVAACKEHNRIHHPAPDRQPLLSLIYESFATPGHDPIDLEALLVQSRAANRTFGVTGMLVVEDGWFLQALEGPEPIVGDLMARIRRDPRHRHVRVLQREIRSERRFPDWAMAPGRIGDVEALPLAQYYDALLSTLGRALATAAPIAVAALAAA